MLGPSGLGVGEGWGKPSPGLGASDPAGCTMPPEGSPMVETDLYEQMSWPQGRNAYL